MSDSKKEQIFLSLGGNIGDPSASMANALKMLDSYNGVRVIHVSSVYRTPPWGKLDQPDFLNAVAELETSLSARDLLNACLSIELMLKRERHERWGPRLIDLDILLYGKSIVHEDGLHIPHPRMTERAFVLVPLMEIAPELVLDGREIGEILGEIDCNGIDKITTDENWWQA